MWAPWRMDYVKRPRSARCIFCEKGRRRDEKAALVLCRGKRSFVLMNLFPYNNAHLMIAPYSHIADPTRLPKETLREIAELTNLSMAILRANLRPEGFNFGANFGKIAGAGVEEHVHYHLVPRWGGDTNFMPVTGHTKVVIEGLKETYDRLRPAFDRAANRQQ